MKRRLLHLGVVAVMALTSPAALHAHELPGASATVVVRDGGFVELRLLVPWSELLHAQWMPRATAEVFLGTIANQSPAAFARTFAQITARLERELRLVANGSRQLAFERWHWPAAADVQAALKAELMMRLATPGADQHGERLLTTADVQSGASLASVQLQTSSLLGPTLVTAYRPTEQMVRAGGRSAAVPVGR
jgi:hypothetical protein